MKILRKIRVLFGRGDVVVFDSSVAATMVGMQRDLDAYRHSFVNIYGFLAGKFGVGKSPALAKDDAHSKEVNKLIGMLYDSAQRLRRSYDELQANMDGIIDEKLEAERRLEAMSRDYEKLLSEYNALKVSDGVNGTVPPEYVGGDMEPVESEVL